MWKEFWDKVVYFYDTFGQNWFGYLLQFILFFVIFYCIFLVLRVNKANIFIPFVVVFVLLSGFAFGFSNRLDSGLLFLIIFVIAMIVFTMFHTEIKRILLDASTHRTKRQKIEASGIDFIIEETVRAVQNMSKNNIGALIVLSDENLPEGIIESGTVVNARVTSQMIEAIFYPKAPLHDGAMIMEGDKIYAAGCFLPIYQSDNLPKEMGSRHRAALGITSVASVTAIVVSEETGIISIAKNGAIVKKYADAMEIKKALSDFYWSDLSVEKKR